MKAFISIITIILIIYGCGSSNSSELSEIPEKYHGIWSVSYTTDGGVDVESYLDISSLKITHHLQNESGISESCFFEKTVYMLDVVDGQTIKTDGANFTFSEPRTIDDGYETWTEMEVSSSAIYDDREYSLNSAPIALGTPQCD